MQSLSIHALALESILKKQPFSVTEEQLRQALKEAEKEMPPVYDLSLDNHSLANDFISRATKRLERHAS